MTKQEVLNAVITMAKETGQGLSGIVKIGNDPTIVRHLEALLKEGYITKHETQYSHLPDDVWYMPKNCYNMYTDTKGTHARDSMENLNYVRVYLGQDNVFDIGNIKGPSLKELFTMPEFLTPYAAWLQKNEKELVKLKNLKFIILDDSNDSFFSKEELKEIETFSWYKNNASVKDCIVKVAERIENFEKAESLRQELLDLYEHDPKKYEKDIVKEKKEQKKNKVEQDLLNKISDFLNSKDKKKLIREFFEKNKDNTKVKKVAVKKPVKKKK